MSVTSKPSHPFLKDGYHEAVFSVSDVDLYVAFFMDVAGWDVLSRHRTPREILDAYGLDRSVQAEEVVMGNPGSARGFVRLIGFTGAQQRQIRSNARSWDTGGFFDVNARVLDMAGKFDAFQRRHWQGETDPIEFTFGPFVIQEWLSRGPDGIVMALVQRITPPLPGPSDFDEIGPFFNATQVVDDADAAREFYQDVLGFQIYLEDVWLSESPEPTVLGMPHNLATTVPRKVYIVHPHGTNSGSLELLEFDGITGNDLSARAQPPNLGILTLRYPLHDLDGFVAHLSARGIEMAVPPVATTLAPYGAVRLLAIRGPGGVWLEFFEAAGEIQN